MSNDNQNVEQDLKALNTIYDELSKDARTIATDLSETVSAYFILGFYLIAFSLGMDYYLIATRGISLSDYGFLFIWIVFVNLIPLTAGSFVLRRYNRLNNRYKTLFSLEKNIRIKEAKKKRENGN